MNWPIIKHNESLFSIYQSTRKSPLGRRMIILKGEDTALMIHSSIALSESGYAELDTLGTVKYILIPNKWHTADAMEYKARYPFAQILAPQSLIPSLAIKGIQVNQTIESGWPASFLGTVAYRIPEGLKSPEVLLLHVPSKTLVAADMFFNFSARDFSGLTSVLMRLNGATKGLCTTRAYKMSMIKTYSHWKNSLISLLNDWGPEQLIVCHGHHVDS